MRCVPIAMISAAVLLFAGAASVQGQQWQFVGLSDQIISGLAIDPANSSRIYVGTTNGVFLSTDGGQTWANTSAGFPCFSVGTVLIDPQNSQSILALANCFSPLGQPPTSGIMKSTDAGTTWVQVYTDNVYPLAMDATDPSILYAAYTHYIGSGALYNSYTNQIRSTDSGQSWKPTSGGCFPSCTLTYATSAAGPGIIYSGDNLDNAFGQIGRSTDYGQSWSHPSTENFVINSLAVDPINASIVLAGGRYGYSPPNNPQGVFRSTDGGSSWTEENTGLTDAQDFSIVINPRDSSKAFLSTGTGKVFSSTDGGQTWSDSSAGLPPLPALLAFDSTASVLYAGTSVGLFALRSASTSGCVPDAATLCLGNGRFSVQASRTDFQGNVGQASVVSGASSGSSGLFWFFGPDNWELLIKVLNGCGVNGHYWVFGAAATDVAYTIQVTDTQTGEIRTYTNPLGTTSPAITDTAAFPGCP